MLFKKGKSGNPKGCPKGAHHKGRPASIVRELAEEASPDVMRRYIRIANGENMEQVVNGEGETISVPAPIREQLKAGDTILKIGVPSLFAEQQTPVDSVKNADAAMALLKLLEEVSKNANAHTSSGSDPLRMANGSPGLQTQSSAARGL